MNLKILHTNDIHSNFENFSKISTLIKRLKDDNTLVLDSGDFTDFKNVSLQGTRGLLGGELLHIAKYDAATIGNNETFALLPTLEYMVLNSKVPYVSSNIFKKDGSKIENLYSSIIVEKNGIRIIIIGLSPSLGPFNPLLGLYIEDFSKSIREELEKSKGKYDISILIDHIGTENDFLLAEEIPEINVIISAHDHKLFQEANRINNTIINSAGCYGEYLGFINLDYKDGKVSLIESNVISISQENEDEEIIKCLNENYIISREILSKPLYEIHKTLYHDNIEENPICNLIADGLRDFLNCDIGLINGGICNGGIKKGSLTELKLIEICPSPLNPTSFNIIGKYLREALEESLNGETCLKEGKGPGFRGRFVGKLHISGGEIYYSNNKIEKILIKGEELQDEKIYSIASSDYLQRGDGYKSLSNNENEVYSIEYIKDIIRSYGNRKDFIENSFKERWKKI